MDHPLQTTRTTAQVTGAALTAIYNKHIKAMGPLQGLVSLQSPVNSAYQRADHIQIHLREHPPYRVSTGQRAAQPSAPETMAPVLLQGVEAPHTCQYHNCGTEIDGGGLDQRPSSGVSYLGEKTGKMIDLLYIPKKAPENSSTLSLQPIPVHTGYPLQQPLDHAVVLHPPARKLLLLPGDVELFNRAVLAAGEKEGDMFFPPCAPAVGLATYPLPHRQRSPYKPFGTNIGFEARAAFTLPLAHL